MHSSKGVFISFVSWVCNMYMYGVEFPVAFELSPFNLFLKRIGSFEAYFNLTAGTMFNKLSFAKRSVLC